MSRRFRYALEPVLLSRQWELDGLKLELGEHNARLSSLQHELQRIEHEAAQVGQAWRARDAAGASFSVDGFGTVMAYLGQLAGAGKLKAEAVAAAAAARDSLIDQVVLAQHGVEAVEQHRDETRAAFIMGQTSAQFKAADEHWSTLHPGLEEEQA